MGIKNLVLMLSTVCRRFSVMVGWLKCCFTSTETVGLLGTGPQDVHLDFHTAPELRVAVLLLKCCFMSTETVGLLGTGAQDVHLDFHTAPEL